MSDCSIRRATLNDADTVAAFNLAIAQETEGRVLNRAVLYSGVRRVLADPQLGVYYVAELNGRVVGQLLVTFEFSDWRDGMFWWIQSVYVHPSARRQGIYTALHRHVEQAAREAGNTCGLRLYVDQRNTAAQATYRHMGMTPSEYELYEVDWSNSISRGPAAERAQGTHRDSPR